MLISCPMSSFRKESLSKAGLKVTAVELIRATPGAGKCQAGQASQHHVERPWALSNSHGPPFLSHWVTRMFVASHGSDAYVYVCMYVMHMFLRLGSNHPNGEPKLNVDCFRRFAQRICWLSPLLIVQCFPPCFNVFRWCLASFSADVQCFH